jgi:Ca2+-binding EF-hand superfamily protein
LLLLTLDINLFFSTHILYDPIVSGEDILSASEAAALSRNQQHSSALPSTLSMHNEIRNSYTSTNSQKSASSSSSQLNQSSPMDHLVLLANQILSTLRDIILVRYRRGRSLYEIYQHFDRAQQGYFDIADFIRAAADLRIEISEKVAKLAIEMIAVDSRDYVTFGEFKVYVLDAEHAVLIGQVQSQVGQLYERYGHGFDRYILGEIWKEDILHHRQHHNQSDDEVDADIDIDVERVQDNVYLSSQEELARRQDPSHKSKSHHRQHQHHPSQHPSQHPSNHAVVHRDDLARALKKIGCNLATADMSRLLDRFDIHGNDECSVPRFMQCITQCEAWYQAQRNLQYQDQAYEEANLMRRNHSNNSSNANSNSTSTNSSNHQLSEEVLKMCEYLGIGVISEENMIWIAVDALRAPLPVNWTVQKDPEGRNYFYNILTHQSRWEHPLDPHFRNLRDRYRQRYVIIICIL